MTLVELMIVVAIIGLLLLIAVPNFMAAHSTSADRACIENLRQLDAAIHIYYMNNDSTWPTMVSELDPYVVNAVPTRCPSDGAAYSILTGSGVAYSSCPNHGNVSGI
jgi:prepilin-type N-terminal cleavage/methylation domain-containing protein